MIFTMIRTIDTGHIASTLICEDVDFINTKRLISVLKEHTKWVYINLLNIQDSLTVQQRKIYDELPIEFKRENAMEVAKKNKMDKRTFDRFLTNKEIFKKEKHGTYTKTL